ncbi:C6 zinc finger domain-containing protein [Xylariomycetidae sp. FL2044]|nr:C6 zinc finger domain-containing protein [Xylariomycetidae sp. FL2044]
MIVARRSSSPGASSHDGPTAIIPRRSRTGTAKVRTGCQTYRKRHIKCDEAKPFCANCLAYRGFCDGYVIKPRKNAAKKPRPKPASKTPRGPASPRIYVQPPVDSIDFENELEMLYFDDWHSLVQGPFGGPHEPKIWSTFFPQVARRNPALRCAALSIGALSRAMTADPTIEFKKCSGQAAEFPQNHHYDTAVANYCKALNLQGFSDPRQTSLPETVLMSILFFIFELLRRNGTSALQHLTYGFVLLQELLDDETHGYAGSALGPRDFVLEILDVFRYLGLQAETVLPGRLGPTPSPVCGLMKMLKDKGHTLDTMRMGLARGRNLLPGVETMPLEFRDFVEASQYWVAVQQWIALQGPLLKNILEGFNLAEVRNTKGITQALHELRAYPELSSFLYDASVSYGQWGQAFEALYHDTVNNAFVDRSTYIQVIKLRIQYLAFALLVCNPKYTDYRTIDSLTGDCLELTNLIEILLQEQGKTSRHPSHDFNMYSELTWHLAFVAINCRDPALRDNAIRVLETYPRRDGLWDTRAFLGIALRNREVEEAMTRQGHDAGNGDGDVLDAEAQWQRLCVRSFLFEDAGARLVYRHMRQVPDTADWELVEEEATFNSVDPEAWRNLRWEERPLLGEPLILQSSSSSVLGGDDGFKDPHGGAVRSFLDSNQWAPVPIHGPYMDPRAERMSTLLISRLAWYLGERPLTWGLD